MEKSAFVGFILGIALAWINGLFKPVGEGGQKWHEPSTQEYYWRV